MRPRAKPDDRRPAQSVEAGRSDGAPGAQAPGSDGASDAPPEDLLAVPITDELDLHPFAARDVPELVAEYLREAQRAGLREVRIVHGKGIGVQRDAVARVLAVHPAVASYGPAPAHRGHWGATIVILRRA